MKTHYSVRSLVTFWWLTAAIGATTVMGQAQEGSYHNWLREQLQTEYQISGGSWVLGETEAATHTASFTLEGVTRTEFTVNDQPFSRGIRLATTDRPDNYWTYSSNFSTENDLHPGDVVLAVLWIRGVQAERGQGFINLTYELGEPPYTQMTNLDIDLTDTWQQWFIPFQVTDSLDRSWLSVRLGYLIQEVEIGGIALLNFGDAYPLEQMPRSTYHLDYEGRSPDAPWRSAARERIETHRMQDVHIQVNDRSGTPLSGAQIRLNMIRPAFGFGSVVAQHVWYNHPQRDTYREKILNLTGDGRSFNIGVLENGMKWPQWENDNFPGPQRQTAELVQHLSRNGLRMRGHTLLWPAFTWLPDDIEANHMDTAYVRNRITMHIDDIMSYPGFTEYITEWDVVNEPAHLNDVADLFGSTDIYADVFRQAAANAPQAKLYVNDYEILTRRGFNLEVEQRYLDIITDIQARGGRVDGIGLQGHLSYPLTPPETVYEILDRFSAGGHSISITEYDTKGVDEFMAGEYMRDFLTIVFSHPAVDNFMMWGIWDEVHWRGDAPLFRSDWSLKPSGQVFLDLVFDEWWTQDSGVADAQGGYTTRAYLGEHALEIEYNGFIIRDTLTLNQEVFDFQFNIDVTTSLTDLNEQGLYLGQNQPNPAQTETIIPFGLKEGGPTRLTLMNSQGQLVKTLINTWMPPGQQEYLLPVNNLPPGIYTYRLEQADAVSVKSMFVAH